MTSVLIPRIDDNAQDWATKYGLPATQAAGDVTAAVRRAVDPTAIESFVADVPEATR